MKKSYVYIALTLLSLLLIFGVNYNRLSKKIYNILFYDTVSNCKFITVDNNNYCKIRHIKYYDTDIYFKRDVTFASNKSKSTIYFKDLDTKDLIYIREKIRKKAAKNALKLEDLNKINLAKCIIENQNKNVSKNNLKIENEYIAEDIIQITQINEYIKNADEVKVLNEDDIQKLPLDIIKNKFNKINYAAFYYGNIINYYTDNGEIILKAYIVNGQPFRYQVYDENNEFYTYDMNKNLLEYSKNNTIFDSENNVIYKITDAEIDMPYIKRRYNRIKYAKSDEKIFYMRSNKTKYSLYEKFNNTEDFIYKSFVSAIDKQYKSGSYQKVIDELESYFENLKINNPNIYDYIYYTAEDKSFTVNIIKLNDEYLISVNNVYVPNIEKTISSMADTINTYEGRCAEPVLKTLLGNNYSDNYFYDLKISTRHDKINVSEHPPCTACNKNISVWGWKYPKTSILKD